MTRSNLKMLLVLMHSQNSVTVQEQNVEQKQRENSSSGTLGTMYVVKLLRIYKVIIFATQVITHSPHTCIS